ncbi:ankyrin repeat domain-containing protein [Leptolyngbya sp. PL-A3]|uniref:ankyrin repeat domain-containing protein n=1 Tax=Leptolyngbya sp. PL-A3 TaxID=2933911 RepID=UPI0032998ED4
MTEQDSPFDVDYSEDELERLLKYPSFTLNNYQSFLSSAEDIENFKAAYAAESLEVAFERDQAQGAALMQTLLEQAVDIEKVDSGGWTRLYRAAFYGNNDSAVTALLKHGANPHARAKDGTTALHAVCWESGPSLLRFEQESQILENSRALIINQLVDAGVDVNAQDEAGNTPLHVAVSYGQGEVSSDGGNPVALWVLLKRDANLNIVNRSGKTPLILAADVGFLGADIVECIQVLVESGAEQHHRDTAGRTALDVAQEHYSYFINNAPGSDGLQYAAQCLELLQQTSR